MKDGEIIFIDTLLLPETKTKKAVEVMQNLSKATGLKPLANSKKKRVLTALYEHNSNIEKSFRNLPQSEIVFLKNLNPLDVLEYIARSVNGNIRELEGSLNTVICQIQLKNGLTINEVKKLVCNNIKPKKNVSVKDIVKIIADFYNVNEGVIYEKTRRREIVRTRQIIMYLLREDYSVSYPLIGQKLGGKDHTTVIHSYEKVKNELKTNPTIYEELERIRAILK